MPRAPSDKKIEAEKLYKKGMKLTDIAKKLDVPEGTVRSWKNRGKWAAKPPKKTTATLQKMKRKTMQRCKRKNAAVSREIKILSVMPHLYQKGIKTRKHMELILKCIGIRLMMKNLI